MALRRLLLPLTLACAPAPSTAQCMLCADPVGENDAKPPAASLRIEIEAGIDFSRVALTAPGRGGQVAIDPRTGQRVVTGALESLSGLPFQGSVLVRGEPNAHVEVSLPSRVTLSTTGGGAAELSELATTLKNNPKLEKDGTLRFTFGGRLLIDGSASGDFRGTIPITVEYR